MPVLEKQPEAIPLVHETLKNDFINAFQKVRQNSLHLTKPLAVEDWMLQSMEEASPIKWHLAHTSWFFETFILKPNHKGYKLFHDDFGFLFNSYYQQIGTMHQRARRGLLSRPTTTQIVDYRRHVDQAMIDFMTALGTDQLLHYKDLILLGLAHEEQHQELMQTDLLHGLSFNIMKPTAYEDMGPASQSSHNPYSMDAKWIAFQGGLVKTGATGDEFAFDNEFPRHQYFLNPFEIMSRPVSNREYISFIEEGGYQEASFWLSDGWALAQRENWRMPLYWRLGEDRKYYQYSLFGEQLVNLDAPVRHVSYYEAAAYASWQGKWLPTETEWEVVAEKEPVAGFFLEEGTPRANHFYKDNNLIENVSTLSHSVAFQHTDDVMCDLYGHVWEWTQSPYSAYPGYKPAAGAIGEYNGKFMSSQMVLRGGSCATPAGHMRSTYRNFFPPSARWQFSGFRLTR